MRLEHTKYLRRVKVLKKRMRPTQKLHIFETSQVDVYFDHFIYIYYTFIIHLRRLVYIAVNMPI